MKDYKKILEGVVNIINTTEKSDIGFANICTYIGENCPELKESEDKKPNGAIVMEDFNDGDGFYKVNLAYLNKEQVEDIEKIVKRWNAIKYDEEAIRACIGIILTDASEQRFLDFNTSLKDCLVWLEKQGERSHKIIKGKNYFCIKTHKYAGLDWLEGIKYYADEDYSLINNGCTCFCPKYSKYEHNNLFEEVECDGCVEKQYEQKPSWSEEDGRCLRYLIECLEVCIKGTAIKMPPSTALKYIEWLKSLKERVQPQLKQEWSEEDEAHLHSIITHLEQWIERHPNTTGADVQGENIAWLKSLRAQKQWKPSDEQMDAVFHACNRMVGDRYHDAIVSVYEQLKKLKAL